MRFLQLFYIPLLGLLFVGCSTTTELAPVLRPVAHELPLAQINHRSGVGDNVEIAIWRDGTVLRRYDNNRYVVAHAMPAILQQLKDRVDELDFAAAPAEAHPTEPPITTLFVAGRRQATRPVTIFSQHHALASDHEFDENAPESDRPQRLLWNAVRENVEICATHTINPEFVPDNFNTRRLWKTTANGNSIAVLEIYGDKIDNTPTFISLSHEGMFPDEL